MPIYEYKCQECGKVSEILIRSFDSQDVQCPACGGRKLDKLLSASYALSAEAPTPGRTCCGKEERCETPPCSWENACRRDRK
ncbi:MAG: FmdB family zinc ribbon protein [Dehalococcoidia bacterium]